MKDFYGISDFYRSLQNPSRVPTAHRHFQVYLYPIYYYQNQVVLRDFNNFYGNSNNIQNLHNNETNGFFNKWFTEDTIEQFSLAIQRITFPTKFNIPPTSYVSPVGNYYGVDGNTFYGKLSDTSVTFTLIDQMEPFFEKKINDWIFTVNRASIPNQAGTLFPKVNMAIKYFKETEVQPGNTTEANFIYYFKEAFPTEFTTCTIDHNGNDSENDLQRSLVFQFNTMYVLHNREFAERHYRLGYLFDPVTIS